MTTPTDQPAAPAKRPYVAPALVEHGSVRTLTQAPKTAGSPDGDGGSFLNDLVDDELAGG